MFLRRLLQPGVNHCSSLRDTLLEHKRFLSDSEFQSLTANGLRKEMLSIIEQEVFCCFVVSLCSFRIPYSNSSVWLNFHTCFRELHRQQVLQLISGKNSLHDIFTTGVATIGRMGCFLIITMMCWV